jgi:hypothetical protein
VRACVEALPVYNYTSQGCESNRYREKVKPRELRKCISLKAKRLFINVPRGTFIKRSSKKLFKKCALCYTEMAKQRER